MSRCPGRPGMSTIMWGKSLDADELAQRAYTFLDADNRQVKERFLLRWQRGQICTRRGQGIIRHAVGLWLIHFGPVERQHPGAQCNLISLQNDRFPYS